MNSSNESNGTRSCLEPFKVNIDHFNNVPIFLFCLGCLVLGSLSGYFLWTFKQDTVHLAGSFNILINEDLFIFYLGMLLPGVGVNQGQGQQIRIITYKKKFRSLLDQDQKFSSLKDQGQKFRSLEVQDQKFRNFEDQDYKFRKLRLEIQQFRSLGLETQQR